MSLLRQPEHIPDALLTCGAKDLHALLGGPSLFYLGGQRHPPLFVTVLQHGNEPTGFEAIQHILRVYKGARLPRAMWLFIANVEAAADGMRVLSHQWDYNRVWPGTFFTASDETRLMQQVVDTVTAQPLFASVDLHNNTGMNPHYGCVNRLETAYLHLAALFARTVVYFNQPVGVQSLAMAEHCPALTLECGQAGESAALQHAIEFLDACLHLHHLPEHPLPPRDINLLQTMASAKVRPAFSIGFFGSGKDLDLRPDIDHHNFGRLEKGDTVAQVSDTVLNSKVLPIKILDDDVRDIAQDFFRLSGRKLVLKRDLIPSMATLDVNIIQQDCLFYVMQEMTVPGR